MNYKLINKLTGEEHICQKMVVDGFDYYVSDEIPKEEDIAIIPGYASLVVVGNIDDMPYSEPHRHWHGLFCDTCFDVEAILKFRKVIATNNPNIDIPKVVDEVEMWINETTSILKDEHTIRTSKICLKAGYNKSQETHPFSEEDMIEFTEWCEINYSYNQKRKHWYKYTDKTDDIRPYTTKELLQLWKEQKPKTIWYE